MGYYSKPIIVTFLGVPGSGKTTFSKQAAKKLKAMHFNSDAMRLAIFESRENAKRIYESGDRRVLNSYVFGAMDYSVGQVLSCGMDVFYDANSNSRADRLNIAKIAEKHGAVAILVWLKTPREVAVRRGQEREESPESPKKTKVEMHNVIERMTKNIEEPDASEQHIVIDGLQTFEEQFAVFDKSTREIIANEQAD